MLVLSRKEDEDVILRLPQHALPGEEIVIKVTGIKGDRVKLGFIAHQDINIRRKEIPDVPRS